MASKTVHLVGDTQRAYAKRLIDTAPAGRVVKIAAETRRDAQNRKLWPMIADLQQQVPDLAAFSAEDIKLRFLNALGVEMRFLPTLEGQGAFPVGLRSSTLTVEQFSGLIELLYAFGAKHGVRWSEPRQAACPRKVIEARRGETRNGARREPRERRSAKRMRQTLLPRSPTNDHR